MEPVIEVEGLGIEFLRNRRYRLSLREMVFKGQIVHPQGHVLGAAQRLLLGPAGRGRRPGRRATARARAPCSSSSPACCCRTRAPCDVHGGVAPLIELTGGFVGDLTARDNIWLTAGLHGLSREQIAERFDEIVDFAEIRDFLDTPFRHFSSGMQVRLGFAVITTLEEPIVLVDEVLAVGDKRFREKCYERMESLVDYGRTLFLVSHSEKDLERFCKRGLYIEGGAGAGGRAGRRRRRRSTTRTRSGSDRGRPARRPGGRRAPAGRPRARRRLPRHRGAAGCWGPPSTPGSPAPALRELAEAADARAVALVDARALTVPTVYGDVVADPRNDSAVLRTGDGRVVALRLRAAGAGPARRRPSWPAAALRRPCCPRPRRCWPCAARCASSGRGTSRSRSWTTSTRPRRWPPWTPSTRPPCGCAAPRAATTASCPRSWSVRCRGGSPAGPSAAASAPPRSRRSR